MSEVADQKSEGALSFSEREMQMLAWAMQSLKSGPPEVRIASFCRDVSPFICPSHSASLTSILNNKIDYEKLASYAGMSNPRSASNAWAKIKGKLASSCDGVNLTPKKGGGRKKAAVANEGAAGDTPARKRAAKKQDVDGEASPKKKTRAAVKPKKENDDDDAGMYLPPSFGNPH